MSQANVLTSASNVIWYTDKCEIVTGATPVTYNIYEVALPPVIVFSGTTTTGDDVIATSAQMYLPANSVITGTGIDADTTIVSQVVGESITISAGATADGEEVVFTVTTPPNGNMYSADPQVAANSRQQIFVGAGNYLTITGADFTARELGTASSATAGVNGTNTNQVVPPVSPPAGGGSSSHSA